LPSADTLAVRSIARSHSNQNGARERILIVLLMSIAHLNKRKDAFPRFITIDKIYHDLINLTQRD